MGVFVHYFTGIVFSFFLTVHPFYVSVCEIIVVEEKKSIQVMQRIFADDLEETLNKKYNLQLDVMALKDLKATDSVLSAYYEEHFAMTLDGEKADFTYLGAELEEDVVWCYLEASYEHDFREILVHNSLLMDEFEGQNNIVHVTKGGEIKSIKLTENKQDGILKF